MEKELDRSVPDLRYLDGPWRNDACLGYVLMAMRNAGLDGETVNKVMNAMDCCFDEITVREAADYFLKAYGKN